MLSALANRGHRVDVALTDQEGPPYWLDGVAVWPGDDGLRLLGGADLIVTHLANTPRAMALGRWNDVPTVVVLHNTLSQAKRALESRLGRVDLVVANSRFMAFELAGWWDTFGRPPSPFIGALVVRPLVDPDDYDTTPGELVTLVNLRRRRKRYDMSKGGELFRLLARAMPDTRFLGVAGAYGHQAELARFPNVEVVDHVPHHRLRDDVLARTRVLLMPSSYESWGRIASEAMSAGIPVVAHPTPGVVEHLDFAGIYVDRHDRAGCS